MPAGAAVLNVHFGPHLQFATAGGTAVPEFLQQSLPANLLQAQRDYFGAHTYERVDAPRGQVFHTNWTGEGNDTAASVYQV